VRLALENGAQVNAVCDDGATALYIAAQKGHLNVARLLLENGAQVNTVRNSGATALYVAAHIGHLDVVRLLLEHGAQVNAARDTGSTALYIAAQNGYLDVARLLLEYGAQVNAARNDGATALFIAAQQGYLDVARLLLEYGAKINTSLPSGATALYIAAKEGHLEVVKFLLSLDADPMIKGKDGTPFEAANNPKIKQILLAAMLQQEFDKLSKKLASDAKEQSPSTGIFTTLFSTKKEEHLPVMQKFILYLKGEENQDVLPEITKALKNTTWEKHCKTAAELEVSIKKASKAVVSTANTKRAC
jgi:ankyrin repeat protein